MGKTDLRKRLAAILVADVAGYSRLMAADDRSTVAALDSARSVFRMQIEANQGRVIDMAGDSVLAVFDTATGAVAAAIAVQEGLFEMAAAVAEDRRMRFRIGVHLGDIVEKADGTVYGDGVNIAARLEGLATPGGITVSNAVQGAVLGRVSATFVDQGEQQLKNISFPIRAFAVKFAGDACKDSANASRSNGTPRAPASRRLSVVVLPFSNSSGDPSQEYFSDGITEDITTQLSRIKGSYVIGRNTAFSYKGKQSDIKAIGKELGVRYVLQGGVERFGDGIEANIQLTDSLTGAILWADTIEADRAAARNIRREVVARMAIALNLQLVAIEAKRSRTENPDNPDAVDLVMRGWEVFHRASTLENFQAAQRLFEEALEIEPRCQPALTVRARVLAAQAFAWPGPDRSRQIAEAETDAIEAILLDEHDATAHHTLGRVRMLQKRIEAAIAENDIALELNPNYVDALASKGLLLFVNGQEALALEPIKKALAQSPRDPARWSWLTWAGAAFIFMGKFEEAIPWLEKSVALSPVVAPLVLLMAAYANVGEMDKALAAKAEVFKLQPSFSITFSKSLGVSTNATYLKHREDNFFSGLRKVGIPE